MVEKDKATLDLSSKVPNGRLFRTVLATLTAAVIVGTASFLFKFGSAVAVNRKAVAVNCGSILKNEESIKEIGKKLQKIGEDTAYIRGRLEDPIKQGS